MALTCTVWTYMRQDRRAITPERFENRNQLLTVGCLAGSAMWRDAFLPRKVKLSAKAWWQNWENWVCCKSSLNSHRKEWFNKSGPESKIHKNLSLYQPRVLKPPNNPKIQISKTAESLDQREFKDNSASGQKPESPEIRQRPNPQSGRD